MTIEEAYNILWLNKDIKYTKKDVKMLMNQHWN